MKKIPVTIPYMDETEEKAAIEALRSGWVAQGPRVEQFEKAVAQHEAVKYGVATSSCTTALQLAMISSGMTSGMDVLVPSFTFVATANSVVSTGADPVFVDIDKNTYNINTDKIRKTIEKKYRLINGKMLNCKTGNILWGIVPVHQFGLCCDMIEINQIASEYNLNIIEDAACALGAHINGTHIGAFGNPACISFHPRKSITTGEGGMVLTDNEALAESMKVLRSHGGSVSADMRHHGKGFLLPSFDEAGFNYRMTDIQGSIGLAQIKKLDFILRTKREKAAYYNDLIKKNLPELLIPQVYEGYFHTYQSYVCMLNYKLLNCPNVNSGNRLRNRLLSSLEDIGIATRQGTHAVHQLGYYKKTYGLQENDFPNAYECDQLSITLPLYIQMDKSDQNYVINTIKEQLNCIL